MFRLIPDEVGDPTASSSSSSSGPVYLSDVDVMSLSDETLSDNFADQHARLVCLACYKIFPAGAHEGYRQHVRGHRKAALRKIKLNNRQDTACNIALKLQRDP